MREMSKSKYYLSILNREKIIHHEVPKEVYIYVKQLEAEIRCKSGNIQKLYEQSEHYDNRFSEHGESFWGDFKSNPLKRNDTERFGKFEDFKQQYLCEFIKEE